MGDNDPTTQITEALDSYLATLPGGTLHKSQRPHVIGAATAIALAVSGDTPPASLNPVLTGGTGKDYLDRAKGAAVLRQRQAQAAATYPVGHPQAPGPDDDAQPLFDGILFASEEASEEYVDAGLTPRDFAGRPPTGPEGFTVADVRAVIDEQQAERDRLVKLETENAELRKQVAANEQAKADEAAQKAAETGSSSAQPDTDVAFASEEARAFYNVKSLSPADLAGAPPKGPNGYTIGELRDIHAAKGG